MSLLLSKLRRAVEEVTTLAEAGVVSDGSEALVRLCTLIEEIFSNNLKVSTRPVGTALATRKWSSGRWWICFDSSGDAVH